MMLYNPFIYAPGVETHHFFIILLIRITRLKIVKKYPKKHSKAQIYDQQLRKSHLDPPSRVGLIHNGMSSILQWKVFNFKKQNQHTNHSKHS